MTRARITLFLISSLAASTLLTACGPLSNTASSTAAPVKTVAGFAGSIHGGQQAISLSTVQLYAVGTGGSATALLTPAVISDLNGAFSISGLYTCPTPQTLVYITASGGNPGLALGTNNSAITLIAALGQCGSLATSGFVTVDEVTTVAAVAALAPYITPPFNISSSGSLASAFATAIQLANPTSGTSPGVGQTGTVSTSTYSVPSATINTLADAVVPCINSVGPTSTNCMMLFPLTGSPTNVVAALTNVELNPSAYNSTSIYNLGTANPAFMPVLTTPPTTFAIAPVPPTTPTTSATGITATPGTATIGSTVVFTGGTFVPPLSVSFAGALASGSFTSSQITVTVPSGAPSGNITGTIMSSYPSYSNPTTYTFNINIYDPSGASGVTLTPAGGVTFPSQVILTQSQSMTVTATNNGAAPVQINNAAVTGGNASSFKVTANGCTSAYLAAGASCGISVAFQPTATGSLSSSLVIYVNGVAASSTVNLIGTGM